MFFNDALNKVFAGEKMGRPSWVKDGRFIYHVPTTIVELCDLRGACVEAYSKSGFTGQDVIIAGHIDMFANDGVVTVGWAPTQADMIADDWVILA